MRIGDRVTAIERRLAHRAAPQIIEIKGGFSDQRHLHASAGSLYFEQTDYETPAAFRDRVLDAATAAGERFLIIGGTGQQR